jgi:hypothetical protein
MARHLSCSVGGVLALACCAAIAAGADLVSPLKDQDAIRGCAWSASSPQVGTGFMFLAELDESKVLMRIDGKDTVLTASEPRPVGALAKVGDTRIRTYKAGDISVTATYTATWVCPAGDEGCEVTKYDVTFTVTRGGRAQEIRASGDVGC